MRFAIYIVGLVVADAIQKPTEKDVLSESSMNFFCYIGLLLLCMDIVELLSKI